MARPIREIPWIVKRGDRFYANWYNPTTRRVEKLSLRTTDESTAQRRFAAFLADGTFTDPRRNARLTVEQALDDYWREHAAVKCADPKRQEDAIRHLKAFFGDMPVGDVTIPKSRAYADARRRGLIGGGRRRKDGSGSDGTIRRELNVLAAAANHARKWKRTDETVSIELPHEKRLGQDDEAPYFTRGEIDLMLSVTDGELHHFINLAYYTGARRRSIEDLTRPQVKFEQGQILLQKPGKRVTKKRQPIVPILAEMRPSLDLLCEGKQDGRLFHTSDFYRPFRGLCEDLGFGDRSHPHLLRHTRATHLLQAGVPIYDVAKLLGDTLVTVDRVYGHHSQHRLAEAIAGK